MRKVAELFPGSFECWCPVESFLKQLGLLCNLHGTCFQCLHRMCQSGVILCGHSFGALVSQVLAEHLDQLGSPVRGLVALDCRSKDAKQRNLQTSPVPKGLSDFVNQKSFRASRADMCCMAPLVPRGALPSRVFSLNAELTFVQCPCHLLDTDHFDIQSSHSWDITT